MKKICWLAFTLINFFIAAQRREMPINIQSPTAASLGKYGDLAMDLSTGRANINVPIYTLQEGGISMEIAMSYDTGGVRVNEVPGWVGQNWALQAGGIITRSVRGKLADETNWNLTNYGYVYDNKGYYYYKDILNTSNWNSQQYLSGLANNALYYPDYEPDVFTFNFMGYSGKFFLGSDGEWKVSSSSNLKVVLDINDTVQPNNYYYAAYNNHNNTPFPKVLAKIALLDDQGNKYVFGDTANQNSIEFTFPNFFNQITRPIISSAWYLTKVYNKYNQLVYDLSYDRGDYVASFYDKNSIETLKLTTDYYAGGGCAYGSNDGNTVYTNGNLIIPSYLKKITTVSSKQILFNSSTNNSLKYGPNDSPIIETFIKIRTDVQKEDASGWSGKDDSYFYYSRRDQNLNTLSNVSGAEEHIYPYLESLKWRKLTNLSVISADQNSLISVAFNYNDNPNSRLRLDKIVINNVDSKTPQTYSFEYNNFDALPLFTSKNIDHFGYYKSTPFLLDYSNPSIHEPSRATDPDTVGYGTLSKITYPTKGYTKLFYEPHTYSQYVGNDLDLKQENGVIGGVRIRSMFDYDGNKIPQIKKFYYVTDLQSNQSSGILLQKNNYYMPNYRMPTSNGVTVYQTSFNISPIVYLSNLMGSPVQYSSVIEDSGKGIVINKYSSYSDFPDYKNDTSVTLDKNKFDPHTEYGYKRGKLSQKQYFDKTGTKIRQEDYSYMDSNSQSVRGFSYTSIAPCSGFTNAPIINGSSYNIFFSDFEKSSQKITNYFPGGSIEESTTYNYTKNNDFGDNFLTSQIITHPDKTIQESFYYPFQVNSPSNTALLNKHNFPVIQQETYLNSKNILKTQSSYGLMPIVDQTQTLLAPLSQNAVDIQNNVEYDKINYNLYDDVGNTLQYTYQNSLPVSLVWGYNKSRIIAKIEGATYNQIKSYISDIVDTSNDIMINSNSSNANFISKLDDFRNNTNLKDFQITTYSYLKGGVNIGTVTIPSGKREIYVYDAKNRLKKILDNDNNIIKEWDYNYSSATVNDIYFNSQKSTTFYRNNCNNNAVGGNYTYTVPEGKYSSTISQLDADQKAQNEISANGQNATNGLATCTPISCPIAFDFSGTGGISVNNNNYIISGTFSTGSNSTNLPWATGVKVATIQGTCRPKNDINSYNGVYYYTIKTNGDIIIRSSNNSTFSNNTNINMNFSVPVN